MAARATRGSEAQFTYDFGIAIAQSTVNKVTRLTGATLTLASAFYSLHRISKEYVDTLKTNALRFGGFLSTMRAMEDAQNRLLKGASSFSVDDQLQGMNRLMEVGVDVGKNLSWIDKSAHAMGKSFSQFAGAINSGIQGNMGSLVEMGVLTQRAVRMFERYPANTIMRQQAIIGFLKQHKGLQSLIKNDFLTIQDEMRRVKESWTVLLQSIMGKPNDPGSFYGQIVASVKQIADAFGRNVGYIKSAGFVVGQVLGWVVKQVGHVVMWLGRQVKNSLDFMGNAVGGYKQATYSLLLWLEFWKVKLVDLFRTYKSEIKTVLKLIVAYKLLKTAFIIGAAAIHSVRIYRRMLMGVFALQSRYRAATGASWLMSLAAWMPRWFRGFWISMGKGIATFGVLFRRVLITKSFVGFGRALKSLFPIFGKIQGFFASIIPALKGGLGFFTRGLKFGVGILRNLPAIMLATWNIVRTIGTAILGMNPIGWVILAIAAMVVLYNKAKWYRDYVNSIFRVVLEAIKLVWNSIVWLYVQMRIGAIKTWRSIKENVINPFMNVWHAASAYISNMWDSFKDTTVGRWLKVTIIDPLMAVFKFIKSIWNGISGVLSNAFDWLSGANKTVAQSATNAANQYGFSAPVIGGASGVTPIGNGTASAENSNPNGGNTMGSTNPILQNPGIKNIRTDEDSSVTIENGGIQINVHKGEGIDEAKLARKIKEVIEDLRRSGDKRGGTV